MQRSTDRIRTTHVGSLARPPALLDLMKAAAAGQPVDPAELAGASALAPVIEGCYPLSRIADAYARVDAGHKRGNVVVTLTDSP